MVFMAAAVVGLAAIILGILWYRKRGSKRRVHALASSMPAVVLSGSESTAAVKWLRNVYQLIRKGVAAGDSQAVYGAADLLKLAIGEGIMRPDEPARLAAVVVGTLRAGKSEAACFILDAYRPLIRRMAQSDLLQTAEQLNFIGTAALKERHNYVAARAVEYLFVLLERAARLGDVEAAKAGFTALTTIGLLTLRRHDDSLFREICVQLEDWLTAAKMDAAAEALTTTFSIWLHKIIAQNKLELWLLVSSTVSRYSVAGVINHSGREKLLRACLDAAGSVSLNLDNQLAPLVLEYCLEFARRENTLDYWRFTVSSIGKLIASAVGEYGLIKTLPLIAPLFSSGCRLMHRQLRMSYTEEVTISGQALHIIVRECLMLLEVAARQQMAVSISSLVGIIVNKWPAAESGVSAPAIAKFGQMLLVYRAENRRRTKRSEQEEMLAIAELSAEDRTKLHFLKSGRRANDQQ